MKEESLDESIQEIRKDTQKELEWSLDLDCYILKIIPIPSSKLIWVVGSEENIFLVDTGNAEIKTEFKNLAEIIFSAEIHPKTSAILLSTSSGVHQVTLDGKVVELFHEESWFEHMAVSDDGSVLLVSKGKLLYFFQEIEEEYKLVSHVENFNSTISGIIFNVDSFLVSGYGGVRKINALNFNDASFFEWKTSLTGLSWSPDKKYIAAGTQENSIHFWQYPLEEEKDFQIGGYPSKVSKLIWSKDGKEFVVNSKNDVHIWDFSNGAPVGKMPTALACGIGKIKDIVYRDNMLVAISDEGIIFYFLPAESKEFIHIHSLDDNLSCVSLSESEDEVYVGSKTGVLYCF